MRTERLEPTGCARPGPALLALLALVAVFAAPTALLAPAQHGPTPVVVDPVRRQKLNARRLVTGEIRARRTSSIATREPGLVLDLAVREGRRVKTGERLARLDDSRLKLELAVVLAEDVVARAALDERRFLLDQAERDLASITGLEKRGAANPKELADARTACLAAKARVSQAEAVLTEIAARSALLRRRLADMTIVAPFDGVVVERYTESGAWVGPGQPLVRLVSVGAVEAWLEVPQNIFAAARTVQEPVEVRVDAVDFSAKVRVTNVVPEIDPRARVFPLVVPLENPGDVLTPGMSVTASIAVGAEVDHLTVSKDALLRGDAGTYLFVARGGDAAKPATAFPVTVKTLFTVGGRVAVEAHGLKPGDLTVVEGNERLFPMMPVVPVPAAGKPAPVPAPDAAGGARKGR